VNHSRRFDQHHQQLRDRIIAGEFGELRSVYVAYYSGWQHNGVHVIDTLSYLFHNPITVDIVTSAWESPYEGDPTMELLARFKEQDAIIHLTGFDERDYQLSEIDLRFNKARLRLEDFGERILLETKYINEIGENVIQMVDNGLGNKTETPMQQAIDLICRSIEENDPTLLGGYLLQDVTETMKTIWQGQEEYEKYRFN
jgi:predicted dehydrogenase